MLQSGFTGEAYVSDNKSLYPGRSRGAKRRSRDVIRYINRLQLPSELPSKTRGGNSLPCRFAALGPFCRFWLQDRGDSSLKGCYPGGLPEEEVL
jgi:hypothetical protein